MARHSAIFLQIQPALRRFSRTFVMGVKIIAAWR
jgi:hypothetical protein